MFGIEATPLSSIEATRPVFWIVMGVSLVIFAWRLSRASPGWDGRLIMSGALLLGLGYMVILPLHHAGVIAPAKAPAAGNSDAVVFWQAVRMTVMNGGWLCFGLGLAWHAHLMKPRKNSPCDSSPHPPAHAPRHLPTHRIPSRKSVA
jgi:hypothetical protein